MRRIVLLPLLASALAGCDLDSPPARYPDPVQQQQLDPQPQQQGLVDPNAQAQVEGQVYATDEVRVGESTTEYVDTDPSALGDFRQTLDPYGQWVEDATYGTVWVPAAAVVGPDFVPYVSSGRWAYEGDYVWVSDYEWGWAPFHYGRWVYVAGIGWAWVPGREYRSAWVVWRTGPVGYGYLGWGPMPPAWIWRNGVAVGVGVVPPTPYTFCGTGDVFAPAVATKVVRGSAVGGIAGQTRPWTPAAPTVGGDRSPGKPTVGPPPKQLGLDENNLPHPPANEPGLMRAAQASKPIPRPLVPSGPPQQQPSYGNQVITQPMTRPASPSGPEYLPPTRPTGPSGPPVTRPTPGPSYAPVVPQLSPQPPVQRPQPQPTPMPPVMAPAPIQRPAPPVVRPVAPPPVVRPAAPPPVVRPVAPLHR